MSSSTPLSTPGTSRLVSTRYGRVAVTMIPSRATPELSALLFIHGNSASRAIFAHQLRDDFGPRRVIAVDLLGHGESDDATHPELAYTHAGYASTLVEVLASLEIGSVVSVGWSLGGYVTLELARQFSGLRGMVLTGTPPVNADAIEQGFLPNPAFEFVGTEVIDADQAVEVAQQFTFAPPPSAVVNDILRTDGRARRIMFEAVLAGSGVDKRDLVLNPQVPLAIIDGGEDPFVNRSYVDSLPYRRLWRSAPVTLEGTHHAAFLEAPEAYGHLLRSFLQDHDL